MKHVSIRAIILSGLFALGTVYSTMGGARSPNEQYMNMNWAPGGGRVGLESPRTAASRVVAGEPNVTPKRSGMSAGANPGKIEKTVKWVEGL